MLLFFSTSDFEFHVKKHVAAPVHAELMATTRDEHLSLRAETSLFSLQAIKAEVQGEAEYERPSQFFSSGAVKPLQYQWLVKRKSEVFTSCVVAGTFGLFVQCCVKYLSSCWIVLTLT